MASSSPSATTAADAARRAAALALALAGCAPAAFAPGGAPVTRLSGDEPVVRVLLETALPALELRAGQSLRFVDGSGALVAAVPAGAKVQVRPAAGRLALRGVGAAVALPVPVEVIGSTPDALLDVQGRPYHGALRLWLGPEGLSVANILPIEEYVAGVVGVELGRRGPDERAALEAQAILARTVALRRLAARRTQAWDLTATTTDQLYRGRAGETPEARAAAAATRGLVLLWGGQPIDAFYHSTCGGRTVDAEEVFTSAARPYLRSVSDLRPDGEGWCRDSPRYRWRETWTPAQLRAALRQGLPDMVASPVGAPRLEVTNRSPSGRVAAVRISWGGTSAPVRGTAVRQALRTTAGQPLWSLAFEPVAPSRGTVAGSVTLEGQGAGHGVGLCQWGAIGRARAGWDRRRILAAYFPGTELGRRW